jgi:sugar lactone lactonase YvrE
MAELDDIVSVQGLLYVTDLDAHAVRAVDPASGAQRVVVAGVGEPQGLAVLPDGRLAVADSREGAVLAFPACG